VNNAGDVLLSSLLAVSWPGDRTGASGRRWAWSGPDRRVRRCLWHQSSDEALVCVEETVVRSRKSDFASFSTYAVYTEANSSQLVAYSMLRWAQMGETKSTRFFSSQLLCMPHMQHNLSFDSRGFCVSTPKNWNSLLPGTTTTSFDIQTS